MRTSYNSRCVLDKVHTLSGDIITIMVRYRFILDELTASGSWTLTIFPRFFAGFCIQDTLKTSLLQDLPDHFTIGGIFGKYISKHFLGVNPVEVLNFPSLF